MEISSWLLQILVLWLGQHCSVDSLKLSEIRCPQLSNIIKDEKGNPLAFIKPDPTTDAEVYETYKIECTETYTFGLDVDPTITCKLTGDGASAETVPQPSDYPKCIKEESLKKIQNEFSSDERNNDKIDTDKLGCMYQQQNGSYKADVCNGIFQYAAYRIDLGCKEESEVLIGYPSLRTFSLSDPKKFGEDVINDANTDIFIKCLAEADTTKLCKDVNKPNPTSRIFVPLAVPEPIQNMVLQEGDKENLVKLSCEEGYSFESGKEVAYGYCSTAAGDDPSSNEFMEENGVNALRCYAKCVNNPSKAKFVDTHNFDKLYMPVLSKDASFTVSKDHVVCPDGMDVAVDFTPVDVVCEGAESTADKYGGVLKCKDCPTTMCYKSCAASDLSSFPNMNSIKDLQTSYPYKDVISVEKESIVCEEGFGIGKDAPDTFTLKCGNDGILSCSDDGSETCPVCKNQCPENPGTSNIENAAESKITSMSIEGEKLDGETVTVPKESITCADNHALIADTPSYQFTCSDGQYECTDTDMCPVCKMQCDPLSKTSFVIENIDTIAEQTDTKRFNESISISADSFTCKDGFSLPYQAAETMELVCSDNGKYTCSQPASTTCPSCNKLCPASMESGMEDFINIDDSHVVKFQNINSTSAFKKVVTVAKDDIICEDGYAIPLHPSHLEDKFDLVCGAGGKYECGKPDHCPVCKQKCKIIKSDMLDFYYLDGDNPITDTDVIPGDLHIEARCKNSALQLLGPRFLGCGYSYEDDSSNRLEKRSSSDSTSTLSFDKRGFVGDKQDTTCQDKMVCTRPKTTNALVDKTGNVLDGETYNVECLPNHVLDLETSRSNSGSVQLTRTCQTEPSDYKVTQKTRLSDNKIFDMKEVICYSGCKDVVFNGTVAPDPVEKGQAPYSEGTTLTFTCPSNYKMDRGEDGQQVCSEGKISVPTCVEKPKPTAKPNPVVTVPNAGTTLSFNTFTTAGCLLIGLIYSFNNPLL